MSKQIHKFISTSTEMHNKKLYDLLPNLDDCAFAKLETTLTVQLKPVIDQTKQIKVTVNTNVDGKQVLTTFEKNLVK